MAEDEHKGKFYIEQHKINDLQMCEGVKQMIKDQKPEYVHRFTHTVTQAVKQKIDEAKTNREKSELFTKDAVAAAKNEMDADFRDMLPITTSGWIPTLEVKPPYYEGIVYLLIFAAKSDTHEKTKKDWWHIFYLFH